jgi:cell division protein FtsW
MLEKHLSGTIIMGLIGLCVMIIGGVHFGWMMTVAGVGGLSAIAAFLAANPYAWERITSFADENADKLDEAWQTTQGLYAIGSGGALGVGLGASRQKYSYVSEAQNDFIFTIWCEELGFVGAVALIILFLLFIWRGYVIAMRAPDTYSALVVFGIISQVGIQAFLNIGVVTDVLPNTGIALPFFSYGGTSLIILLMEMGVVLSISKHSYQKK